MPSYDLHQHLLPEPLVSALSRRTRAPRLLGDRLETGEGEFDAGLRAHELGRRLALLDRAEIDVAVFSLPATLGIESLPSDERAPLLDAYHTGARELVAESGGRLLALSAGVVADGFVGASCPAPVLASRAADLEPLLKGLEARGGYLFVHPGPGRAPAGAPAWWASVVDYTAQMQAAYAAWLADGVAAHPRLRVVFAILAGGAPVQLERLGSRGVELRIATQANVFFDTASYGRRALELCLATFGVRQLVFGTDVPVIEPDATAEAVREFGDAVADAVRRENPSLLLG